MRASWLTPEQRTKFAKIEQEQQEFIQSRLKSGNSSKEK